MKELSGSEALFGFAAWLTTRDEAVTMGAKHDSAGPCSLVKEFCEEKRLVHPK